MIRVGGIFILQFKNQLPNSSATINKSIANTMWIMTETEKTRSNPDILFLHNSNVKKRDAADDREVEKTLNIATTPPTTL